MNIYIYIIYIYVSPVPPPWYGPPTSRPARPVARLLPYCLFTSIHSSPRGYYSILHYDSILHYVSEGTTPRQRGPSAVSYLLQKSMTIW